MNTKFLLVSILLILSHLVFAQEEQSRLSGFDNNPIAGSLIDVVYNPIGGPLEGKSPLTAIVYMFNDYTWKIDDIDLKESGGVWKGKFAIPKDCGFIAFKFMVEGDYELSDMDNNDDKGFMHVVMNGNQQAQPGGALAWAIFRKPSLGLGVNDYFQEYDIMDEAVEMWVYRELQYYPQNMPKFFKYFMAMAKLRSGDGYPQAVNQFVPEFLQNELGEKQFLMVRDILRFEMQDTLEASKLESFILETFPRGELARFTEYRRVFDMPYTDEKQVAVEKFLTDFPVTEWYNYPELANQHFIYYSIYRYYGEQLFGSRQYDKLISILPDLDFQTLNELYRWNIFRIVVHSMRPNEEIYPILMLLFRS